MYESLGAELRKIENSQKPDAPFSTMGHICGQLVHYVQAKAYMVELYPCNTL